MPFLPSEPFLLWQDAAATGRWKKLLEKRLTKPRWIAILMLQSFPTRTAANTSAQDKSWETHEERVKRAIAAGWGA